MLGGGDCPVQIMESWQDTREHRFVIKHKHAQRKIGDNCDSDHDNCGNDQSKKRKSSNQRYIRQQDFMKKVFLTTMFSEAADHQIRTCQNDFSRTFGGDSTASDEEDNTKHSSEDFMSTSEEEDDILNDSLIGC